jgi:hypothetical protein
MVTNVKKRVNDIICCHTCAKEYRKYSKNSEFVFTFLFKMGGHCMNDDIAKSILSCVSNKQEFLIPLRLVNKFLNFLLPVCFKCKSFDSEFKHVHYKSLSDEKTKSPYNYALEKWHPILNIYEDSFYESYEQFKDLFLNGRISVEKILKYYYSTQEQGDDYDKFTDNLSNEEYIKFKHDAHSYLDFYQDCVFCWKCRCVHFIENKRGLFENKDNLLMLSKDHKNGIKHSHDTCVVCKTDNILQTPDTLWTNCPIDVTVHDGFPGHIEGNCLAWLATVIPVEKWNDIYFVSVFNEHDQNQKGLYYKFNPVDFYFNVKPNRFGPDEITKINYIAMHNGDLYKMTPSDGEYKRNDLDLVLNVPFAKNLELENSGLRKILKNYFSHKL